jgi:hypothetical protein
MQCRQARRTGWSGGWIEILDGVKHGKPGRAGGVGVNHSDGIGDMIRDPDLFAIRPDGDDGLLAIV